MALERGVRVAVVEEVGNRCVAGACAEAEAVGTCSGQVVGRTVVGAAPVVSSAKAEAADTQAFEAEGAAEDPSVHCYQRWLATYATDDGLRKPWFRLDRPSHAGGCDIPGGPLDLRSCLIAAPETVHRHTADERSRALLLAQGV